MAPSSPTNACRRVRLSFSRSSRCGGSSSPPDPEASLQPPAPSRKCTRAHPVSDPPPPPPRPRDAPAGTLPRASVGGGITPAAAAGPHPRPEAAPADSSGLDNAAHSSRATAQCSGVPRSCVEHRRGRRHGRQRRNSVTSSAPPSAPPSESSSASSSASSTASSGFFSAGQQRRAAAAAALSTSGMPTLSSAANASTTARGGIRRRGVVVPPRCVMASGRGEGEGELGGGVDGGR